MPSQHDAINALPDDLDVNGIAEAFGNPAQIFRMLDKNNDGRITYEDLQGVLAQFGITGMAANVLAKYIFKQLDANHNGTMDASDLMRVGNILWQLFQQKQQLAGV